MASMQAAVVNEPGKGLAVEEVAVVEPGPIKVLVKLAATGRAVSGH